MRFLSQSFLGLFLAALTLGLVAFAGQMVREALAEARADERPRPPARERIFAVSVVPAVPREEVPVLKAFGEIRAQRSLDLRAAAAGRVIEMAPDFVEGGTVQAGQVLVSIDPANAQSARDRSGADYADAEAEVRDAEAALALARDELAAARDQEALRVRALDRQRDLAGRGVGTAAAVESAELAVSSARQSVLSRRQAMTQAQARIAQSATRLTRAEIALDEAERRLADTVMAAPFDGTLSDVALTQGRLVATNERLAVLVDPAALDVSFRLSTAQYARLLNAGGRLETQPVEVRIDAGGVELVAKGEIRRDSAAVGEAQSGRLVFAALGPAPGFKPGDFVTVAIEEPALPRAVRLPASALGADSSVLVLGEGDRLETLDVVLLRRQGNEVLVRSPALAGREVVTTRTPLLGAGIRVRPLRPDDAEPSAPAAPAMVALDDERRSKLIAFVEGNKRIPAEAKERILARLAQPEVPAQMVNRLESRMGG